MGESLGESLGDFGEWKRSVRLNEWGGGGSSASCSRIRMAEAATPITRWINTNGIQEFVSS